MKKLQLHQFSGICKTSRFTRYNLETGNRTKMVHKKKLQGIDWAFKKKNLVL